jgi:hypothetical protein
MKDYGFQEEIYRYLFIRDITRHGIDDTFYPVGSAANYSLMYLVTRCMLELPVTKILEFGAGQTSVLLDRLRQFGAQKPHITTIEQDEYWATRIGGLVAHSVVHVPLNETVIGERTIRTYDKAKVQLADQGHNDFILVDGPTSYGDGGPYSRIGSLDFLRNHLADQFVVIFDDTERRGEGEAVAIVRKYLAQTGITFFENTVRAAKQQSLFCTEKFRLALYF